MIPMDAGRLRLILYTAKCVLGLCAGYALYRLYPQHQFYWSIISILLVLAPDGKDSNKLAFERVVANVIGSGVGFLVLVVHQPNLFLMSLGVILTIAICTAFKVETVFRSALVSLIIVAIHQHQIDSRQIALERIGCVFVGCLIALVINYLFNFVMPPKAAETAASGE
jgi:uncharacterized membrane protein YgaE (UPF0421/DUF939 family)